MLTTAMLGQIWLLSVVLGISALAVVFALFVQVDESRVRAHVKWFYHCSVWLLWVYVALTAFVATGFALGFGVTAFRDALKK